MWGIVLVIVVLSLCVCVFVGGGGGIQINTVFIGYWSQMIHVQAYDDNVYLCYPDTLSYIMVHNSWFIICGDESNSRIV